MMIRSTKVLYWGVALLLIGSACEVAAPRGMVDAGVDATPDASPDGEMDATPDSAADGRCDSNFDCPPGVMCIEGRCQTPGDECTSVFDCPEGLVCVDGRCAERMDPTDPGGGGGGTCCDGAPCEGDFYCDESCTCADPTVCDPPCADPLICDYGYCTHPCIFDGCEGDMICMEDGCREPRCTYEECISMSPMLACDPYDLGCYDPCDDVSIVEMCDSIGAICEFGTCVDPTCTAVGSACLFVEDCCGTFICQAETDPPLECPETCGEPEEMPPAEFCACDAMAFCTDHRWSAGYMSGPGRGRSPGIRAVTPESPPLPERGQPTSPARKRRAGSAHWYDHEQETSHDSGDQAPGHARPSLASLVRGNEAE